MVKEVVEEMIKSLRGATPLKAFDNNKLAEIEINKFFYDGKIIDRIMVVLRANGCEHYKKTGGCSMCSHFNGTPIHKVVDDNYIAQWNSVLDGSAIEKEDFKFNLDNYPVLCLYNLGSLFNENEISLPVIQYIFKSLNDYKNVKKVIVESRAEYVTEDAIKNIKNVYNGIVEVGIGVESTNKTIRELCHHKGIEDIEIIKNSVKILHDNQFKALAYINFKPVFLTEKEAVDDAIQTAIDCFKMGFDAVSIEPTSLQDFSLANYLYEMGQYRVPWLWSIEEIVEGIYKKIRSKDLDIRIGGYFDEEILSGSQGMGFEGRNEVFPHMTSANCPLCTNKYIDGIKKFNATYDIKHLKNIEKCPHCYPLWCDIMKITDSRSIEQRIKDILKDSK